MTSLIADKTRAGLMGPGHVRRLDRLESAVNDPLIHTSVVPTLDLDFTSFDGAPFDDFFSRSGAGGYRVNNKGILVPTVDREPVIDFADGVERGTAFYGGYTNLALRSEEFDNATWSKTNTTITPNVTLAPDGSMNADTLTDTNAAGDAYCRQSFAVANDAATYTASVFLKQGTAASSRLTLTLTGGTQIVQDARLIWSTGAVVGANALVEDAPNGFKRVSVTITNNTSGNTSLLMDIRASGDPTGVETGNVGAWGAQLTATAFPVPYLPTTSAAVGRAADSMVIDDIDWFNSIEGTFFVDSYLDSLDATGRMLFQMDDNANANRIYFYRNTVQLAEVGIITTGNVTQASFSSREIWSTGVNKLAVSYKANNFGFSFNGATALSDVSGSVPVMTMLRIGSQSGGGVPANSHIRRVIYFPEALDAATLQRMTA